VHNSSFTLPFGSHLRRPHALAEHSLELRAMGWNGVDDSGSEATASPAAAPCAWAALDDSSGADSGSEGWAAVDSSSGTGSDEPFHRPDRGIGRPRKEAWLVPAAAACRGPQDAEHHVPPWLGLARPIGAGDVSDVVHRALHRATRRRSYNYSGVFKAYLGDRPWVGLPKAAQANLFCMSRTAVDRQLTEVAASVFVGARMLFSSLLSTILTEASLGKLTVMLTVVALQFDETPLWFTDKDKPRTAGAPGAPRAARCCMKVFQTECQIIIMARGDDSVSHPHRAALPLAEHGPCDCLKHAAMSRRLPGPATSP